MGAAHDVMLTGSMRAAAALLQTIWGSSSSRSRSSSDNEDAPERQGEPGVVHGQQPHSDVGCLAVIELQFVSRPEWLCPGSRLVVRDRDRDGHIAGAGYIRHVLRQ